MRRQELGTKRERLPATRKSVTHKVVINDQQSGAHDIYIIVGKYEDGRPGELFIKIGKWGSTLNGLMDDISIKTSQLLQYGIPLSEIAEKSIGTNYIPNGPTDNKDIPTCLSIPDYIFKWMVKEFPDG
jgi:ribonucleoside-diphosphate reductase alpha chain